MTCSKLSTGQEKKIEMYSTRPVDKRLFSFPCPTFNSTCPLSKLERTESYIIPCPEKCTEELCPKCLPVLWTSKHKLRLVPQIKYFIHRVALYLLESELTTSASDTGQTASSREVSFPNVCYMYTCVFHLKADFCLSCSTHVKQSGSFKFFLAFRV